MSYVHDAYYAIPEENAPMIKDISTARLFSVDNPLFMEGVYLAQKKLRADAKGVEDTRYLYYSSTQGFCSVANKKRLPPNVYYIEILNIVGLPYIPGSLHQTDGPNSTREAT